MQPSTLEAASKGLLANPLYVLKWCYTLDSLYGFKSLCFILDALFLEAMEC